MQSVAGFNWLETTPGYPPGLFTRLCSSCFGTAVSKPIIEYVVGKTSRSLNLGAA